MPRPSERKIDLLTGMVAPMDKSKELGKVTYKGVRFLLRLSKGNLCLTRLFFVGIINSIV